MAARVERPPAGEMVHGLPLFRIRPESVVAVAGFAASVTRVPSPRAVDGNPSDFVSNPSVEA